MSGGTKLTPKYELLVDGSPVDPILHEALVVLRLHQHLELADCLELRISNNDLTWTESTTLEEGKEVSLKLGYEETTIEQVFKGEIVRRDCEFPTRGPAVVTVVAFDKEHRLKRGRYSRVWLDMKDSDVISQMAGEAGLSGDVEATQVTHRYLFQNNQTNLSWIRERAMRLNYHVDVDVEGAKLVFKKAEEKSPVETLKWGENLLSFDQRISTDQQVSKVVVKGWDMTKKEKIEAKAEVGQIRYLLDGSEKGSQVTEKAHGKREILYCNRPIFVTEEAQALAEARLNQLSLNYVDGQGSAQGSPKIVAGSVVEIEGVGSRAGGQFYVIKTLHMLEPRAGYATYFDFVRSAMTKKGEERKPLPEQLPPREDGDHEVDTGVEIIVRSESGESMEGVKYTVTLPNGEVKSGTLTADQTIKIEGIRDPGEAKIEFEPPEGLDPVGKSSS